MNNVKPVHVIINVFLQQYIQWCICRSGNVDVRKRNKKWFFSRHVQFDSEFHVMALNEISCKRPEVIFSFRIIQRWLFLKWDSSDFPWRISCSSPCCWRFRVTVDVLRRCSLPKIWTVPSATGHMKFPLLCSVNTSFALSHRAWTSDASISSNSSMSASFPDSPPRKTHSRETITGETFGPNWWSLDWSLEN